MHALIPLTDQEEAIKELLDARGIDYRVHEVFPYKGRSIVADYFLPERNLVIECWMSGSRRGVALGWMERNGIYVDYKFKRLKETYHGIGCGALVEATQVDLPSLREWVGAVMPHADWVAFTMEEFELRIGDSRRA